MLNRSKPLITDLILGCFSVEGDGVFFFLTMNMSSYAFFFYHVRVVVALVQVASLVVSDDLAREGQHGGRGTLLRRWKKPMALTSVGGVCRLDTT